MIVAQRADFLRGSLHVGLRPIGGGIVHAGLIEQMNRDAEEGRALLDAFDGFTALDRALWPNWS